MIESLPVVVTPVPWEGDGPSVGIGNNPSDAVWGETEYVTGAVIVQWPRVYKTPVHPMWVETARVPDYPGPSPWAGDPLYGAPIPAYPAVPWGVGAYQDTLTPGAARDGTDIQLGAPAIPS